MKDENRAKSKTAKQHERKSRNLNAEKNPATENCARDSQQSMENQVLRVREPDVRKKERLKANLHERKIGQDGKRRKPSKRYKTRDEKEESNGSRDRKLSDGVPARRKCLRKRIKYSARGPSAAHRETSLP